MNDILKHRSYLMAFAIIGILLCHFTLLTSTFHFFSAGSLGVEIFFFLSGMGLVLSWKNDSNPLHYYKKRFLRILPSYYLAILWFLFLSHFWGQTDERMYSSLFVVGPWLWFISYLFVLYLVFPLYMVISAKIAPSVLFSLIVSFTLVTMSSIWYFLPDDAFPYLDMKIGRIPCFFLGCLVAQKPTMLDNKRAWWTLAFLAIAGYVLCLKIDEHLFKMTGIIWMLRMCVTPCFCFLLAALCVGFEKLRLHFLLKSLTFIGGITFEIYLTEGYFSAEINRNYPLILQPLGWIACFLSAYGISLLSKRIRTGVDVLIARCAKAK